MSDKELYGYSEDQIVTFEFEDGTEEWAELGVFDVDGKDYIAFNPLGTEDVYIFGFKEHENDYDVIDIEDDEEYAKVCAEFDKLVLEEI